MPFPAQLQLYRVMISCTHFGVLQALPKQRNHHAPPRCFAAQPIGPIGPIGPITPIVQPKRCPRSAELYSLAEVNSAPIALTVRRIFDTVFSLAVARPDL